jgi:ABC-type Zn uptake system ZnuABC Zn-binding protein ZnuA
MGTGGLQKYIQQAKDAFRIDPQLAKQYEGNAEKYGLVLFNQDRFRQSKSELYSKRKPSF